MTATDNKRAQFEAESYRNFPSGTVTNAEREAWINRCVEAHPGHDKEITFRPEDSKLLFQRQDQANKLLLKLNETDADLLRLIADYMQADKLAQSAILAELTKASESMADAVATSSGQMADIVSSAKNDLIDDGESTRTALISWASRAEVALVNYQAIVSRETRLTWYWRGGIATLMMAVVGELAAMIYQRGF